MDDNKGLNILGSVMGWEDDEARREFAWLKMMAAIKYDDYRDFLPGMRFLENLAAWLQQFDTIEHRRETYALLRHRLIYISPPEMQRLVELFYPCEMERRLVFVVAQRRAIEPYRVRIDREAREDFLRLRRRTLILGLSDGARIDILRHSNVGVLSNEQFVIQTQVDVHKWESLVDDLRKDQKDDTALFEMVFLVDDFMGTGSSYLRFDKEKSRWKGRLPKFLMSLKSAEDAGIKVLADTWTLCVHHYLSTTLAADSVAGNEADAVKSGQVTLRAPSHYSFGAVLGSECCVVRGDPRHEALVELTDEYYNANIETKHTAVGGTQHIGLGYGACGLPLVLHHNTPNNSLALLWAEAPASEKDGIAQREMRPLFRRRQRHTE